MILEQEYPMKLPDIRRIVTAHDENGKAIIAENGPLPNVNRPPTQPGLAFHEIWNTSQTPMPLGFTEEEPTDRHLDTAPPRNGTIVRIVDIPPEGENGLNFDKEQTRELLNSVGLGENAKHAAPGRHPLMHRTESVDYGFVISGEIYLVLDDEEVFLRPGDVVVQRGTIHAWANRSREICRMAFILTDARFDADLASAQAAFDASLKVQSS